MRRLIAAITLCCFVTAQAPRARAQADPDMTAAHAANQVIRNGIQPANAASVVPGYTSTPPEVALHGIANLRPAAEARLAGCAMATGDPACEAQVGAVASANTPRPPIPATDSGVAGAKAVAQDPFATFNGLASYYSGCSSSGTCSGSVFCIGEKCFDTTSVNDPDFAQAMTYMEAGREAGVYIDPASLRVFSGEQNNCRNKLAKNCCYADGAGAGYTNQSLMGTGSRLVYDVLMNSSNREFLYQGVSALLTSGGFSGSFTSYGVTVAVNGTALPAGSVTLATSESLAIAFDPWTLAIAVIIYVVMQMMSCNAEEGKLAMKEGARLCRTFGSWCSSCIKILGHCVSCIEHTTSKCCFNSLLAKILNEQGRAQIGKGWGSDARHPDCAGFTVAELQTLDFSKMDLSEFYASIVPTMPNNSAIQATVTGHAGACYFGGGKC